MATRAVYPRVCGGTAPTRAVYCGALGLSPRVRGNRAGVHSARGRAAVYPRVCGGTPSPSPSNAAPPGLSPRVRGNRPLPLSRIQVLRSIPACAGEPIQRILSPPERRVYPRVCGGTPRPNFPPPAWGGLSPRVRGNLAVSKREGVNPGSIPACAGEPQQPRLHGQPNPVYPRVCGGTPTPARPGAAKWGLSPRVRGNPSKTACTTRPGGSIPACAGEPNLTLSTI